MMNKAKPKAWSRMKAKSLAAATAEFDREFVVEKSTELSSKERSKWTRAKRKRGRPKIGAGAKVVSVTIEKTLLRRVDALAKKSGTSRAKLIAAGLSRLLRSAPLKSSARGSRAA